MRLFPRAARRRLLATSLAAVAIGGLFTTAAHADHGSELKKQQRQVQTQVKGAQKDLDGTSQQLLAAEKSLSAARAQLARAQAHVRTVQSQLTAAVRIQTALENRLRASQAQLDQAKQDAAAGQAAVTDQREAVRRTILDSYAAGDPQMAATQALIDGTSLDDVAIQQNYNAAASQLQANNYQSLQASEVLLTVHQQDVARVTAQVAADEKQAAAKVAEVRALRQQAIAARDQLAQSVATRRSAEQAAVKAKAYDARQLAALQKKEDAIKQKILALASTDTNRVVGHTAGMFLSPVANTYITSPYGYRFHPIFHYYELHNGDDLHAPCGTPEVAVGNGKVIEEYFNVAWGNRLYLDLGNINGHNYTAIYNHIPFGGYRVHVGQEVKRGQEVSIAGTTGWSTACHIHFTIMRDGVAVDPTKLIGM